MEIYRYSIFMQKSLSNLFQYFKSLNYMVKMSLSFFS